MAGIRKPLHTAGVRAATLSSAPLGFASLFVVGLVVRLLLAPHGGFPGDLLVFQHWEDLLANQDWSQFSDPRTFIYYPFLYVLWALGQVSRILHGTGPDWTLLKIPPILADLGLAWVTALIAQRLTPWWRQESAPVRGPVAAAILLNPALIFLSALWGQVDSIGAMLLMGSLLFVATGPSKLHREAIATVLFALAVGIKPQVGVVLPLLLLILVRRHLRAAGVLDRRNVALVAARLASLGALALVVILLIPAPFGLDPPGVISYYAHAPTYAFTSANAFNLWGVLGFWVPDLTGPTVYTVLGVPAFWIGAVLFVAAMVAMLVIVWREMVQGEHSGRLMVFGTAAFTCLSFAVLTRGHERYLFAAIPCLAVFWAQRPLRRAFYVLSGLLLVNIYFPYVFFVELYGQRTFVKIDWLYNLLFGTDQDSFNKKLLSLVITIVCLVVAGIGWRWAALGERARIDFRAWLGSMATLWHRSAGWRAAMSKKPEEEVPVKEAGPWWQRFAPLLLVATACGFNLVVLNAEATPVHDLNDSSYHFAMLRWARTKIDQGKLPLDGWYPNLGLGLAQFHHYQSLPHVIGAYISIIFGEALTFYWVLYLGVSLWPISVYLCARWLGWDRWTAGAAALVAPLLVSVSGYGYEDGSYTWRGYGTWSQLWGMWLLPLAWGLSWRAVKGVGSFALGALAVALTVAVHFVTGYLALLSIGVWAVVAPSQLIPRFRRAIVVGVGAVLVGSWVIVPLIVDSPWASNTQFERGTIFYDSFGAPKILGWLISGQVFDHGRLPVVTVLGAVGLVVCLVRFRRDERARALLGVWLVSLLLFFGRPTLGSLLKILPGSDDLPLHRYINGVHLGGILLAGVGGAWLGGLLVGQARRRLPTVKPALVAAAICIVGLASLNPAWTQLATINQEGAGWIAQQVQADATDGADLSALVDKIYALGPGRVYAGSSANWGGNYRVGFVPVYAELANYDIDTIGFYLRTESLSTDVETLFDESNPAQYDLFNIRYLILPQGKQPPVKARLIAQQGRHTLWTVDSTGYMEVVDAVGAPIVADRKNIGGQTLAFDRSPALAAHLFPMVAFDGAPAAPNTITAASQVTGPAGTVVAEDSSPDEGTYAAEIEANRPAVVMLKTTFEPRWRVTVDGVEVQSQMIAPSFVARTVPAGRHSIEFRYIPYPSYPQLLALGLLTLAGLQFGPRLWRRFGGRLPIRL